MKKHYLLIGLLILSVVFISGCTGINIPPMSKPYIDKITPDADYAVAGQRFGILVSVTNPTTVNLNGTILINADSPSCFDMNWISIGSQNVQGITSNILVLNKRSNTQLIAINIPISNQDTCYNPALHKLNVFLLQNDEVLASKMLDISLFNRR